MPLAHGVDGNGQTHAWNVHNGRKFGKRYGHKGGKARWASMTQEEKDLFEAKKRYHHEQSKMMKNRLHKASLTAPRRVFSKQDLEDIEEFFGDII